MLWCLRLTLPVWRSAIPIRLYALTTSSWTVLPSGFDANRFYYGDIEGNGKYRVQLFQCLLGRVLLGNAVPLSPFSNVENQGTEPAIHFKEKLEIVCTVITTVPVQVFYTPQSGYCQSGLGEVHGGYNAGATFEVKYEKLPVQPCGFLSSTLSTNLPTMRQVPS